jgi:putative methyltransferase (TIGR04325 family)
MSQPALAQRHLSLFKTFEEKMRNAIFATPLVSDFFRQYWRFLWRVGACRGVYANYREASKACAAFKKHGYNDALFYGPAIIGEPVHMRKRDYPVLYWLSQSLKEGTRILNLGGNAGTEYFTYRQFIHFPDGVRWIVWELPAAVNFGQHLAQVSKSPDLSFTTRLEDGDGADIVLVAGALQYIEEDLPTCLKRLSALPPRLVIHRTPLYEGETFFTMQSTYGSVVPYRIQNRQELADSLLKLGYRMVDCWCEQRSVIIPFYPARSSDRFYGFYFVLDDSPDPTWKTDAIETAMEVRKQIRHPWSN